MCTGLAAQAGILKWVTPTPLCPPKKNVLSPPSNVSLVEKFLELRFRIFPMKDFLHHPNPKLWLSASAIVAALFLAAASAASAKTSPFWDTWGDGKAELDGYTLIQPRYGE